MMVKLILIFCYAVCGASFLVGPSSRARPSSVRTTTTTSLQEGKNSWNPLKELGDMMANFDDVIDDFVNKRMGNGEIFYGQRKYKPSGRENTTGQYSGMGMSDKARIDRAREYKEEMMEIRRLREQGLKRD